MADILGYEPIETSHWHSTAQPLPALPALNGTVHADVVVIGGGYTGLSTALHAARRGLAVVLLEANEPGWAASGRNAAQVCPLWGGGDAPSPNKVVERFGPALGSRMNRLIASSGRYVYGLIDELAIDCNPRRDGLLMTFRSQKSFRRFNDTATQYVNFGAPVEVIEKADLKRYVGSDRYVAGVRFTDGGLIQPLAYARGLALAAQRAGVSIHAHSGVQSITRHGDTWQARTPNGQVEARHVVIATGAYNGDLVPQLRDAVYPVVAAGLISQPLGAAGKEMLPQGGPMVDADDSAVFSPALDPEGRLMVTVLPGPRARSIDDLAPIANRRLRRAFPQLPLPQWQRYWFGRMLITPDHLPHIVKLGPNMYGGLACNGLGITIATCTGRELARLASGESEADIDLPVSEPKKAPMAGVMPALMRNALFPLANRFGA